MEFDINVNVILRDVITKVDCGLQVCRTASTRFPDARQQLFKIIDKMGEASARAQSLPGPITTGRKLETSDHHLYIIKDPEGSRGTGAVVGILKMGRKRLFVYDRHGQQWEMNPLCVLDFYVHESRQRMGCGRRLFDFMLKNENTIPQHLAVDRPSVKFSSFLAKHYGMDSNREIQQVNNFVIFDGFFTKRPDSDFIHNKRNTNSIKPADYPGSERPPDPHHQKQRNNQHAKMNYQRVGAGLPSLMPRHQNQQAYNDKLRELNLNPRSAHYNKTGSPDGLSEIELRSTSAGSGSFKGNSFPLQSAMYSRHQPVSNEQPSRPPSGNRKAANMNINRPPSGNRNVNRPPSGNRNAVKNGGGGGDVEDLKATESDRPCNATESSCNAPSLTPPVTLPKPWAQLAAIATSNGDKNELSCIETTTVNPTVTLSKPWSQMVATVTSNADKKEHCCTETMASPTANATVTSSKPWSQMVTTVASNGDKTEHFCLTTMTNPTVNPPVTSPKQLSPWSQTVATVARNAKVEISKPAVTNYGTIVLGF